MAKIPAPNFPNPPKLPCQCFPQRDGCVCLDFERALKAWAYRDYQEPMTAEQRSWCIEEIFRSPDPMLRIPLSTVLMYSDKELAGVAMMSLMDQLDAIEHSCSEGR
jgi:hypothetical protein